LHLVQWQKAGIEDGVKSLADCQALLQDREGPDDGHGIPELASLSIFQFFLFPAYLYEQWEKTHLMNRGQKLV
jgi:hypothetical protein